MSTRVLPVGGFFNFNRMSEFRRRLEPPAVAQQNASQTEENSPLASRNVVRNLFGPIDHDENVKFVQEEMAKIVSADRRRWNFDFCNDVPLDGRYSWEVATGGNVPVAYDMPNLTAKLTLPNSNPSTSKVTNVISSTSNNVATTSRGKVNDESSIAAETPLRSTLTTVTTATTTVMSLSPNKTSNTTTPVLSTESINKSTQVEPCSTQHQSKKAHNKKTKQPQITEFLKIRKRSHSTDAKIESEESLPSMKRAKTSS